MSTLDGLATAQGIDRYVEKKVSTELIRQRPAPRYAVVQGIDLENKIAEVSYVGEDSVVKVPFTNVVPNEVGQEVRIEGVPGDRYITAIRGLSADEAGILDLGENLELAKSDIADALNGQYAGSDGILNQIQDWAQGILGGGVGEFVGSIFTGGGLFNLGQLTNKPINLISYTGEFDLSSTVKPGEGWSYDESQGHTNPGSAKFTATEAVGGVLTPPRPARVEPEKQYPVEAWVKWQDIAASGESFAIDVTWYRLDRTQISTTVAASVTDPADNSDWIKLSGNVTAPSEAFWAAVFFRVGPLVSSGYVWFDDAGIFASQASLPQILISGLPEDLQNLFGWMEALVNQFLGALGVPAIGTLFDKIADLSDEIGDWFGNTESIAGEFYDLIQDLMTNPIAVIGSIPQSLISGVIDILKIPNLSADKITSGIFGSGMIPNLPVTKITNLQSIINALDGRTSTAESNITDLQGIATALTGVIGYGSSYMSSSPGVNTSPSLMPFDTRLGGPNAMVGCELGNGRYTLRTKGLWRFEAQVRFWGAKYAPPKCFMDIVIRLPNGTEVTRIKAIGSSDDEITVTNVMPAVVPVAGCTAEVQAWTSSIPLIGGNWRGIGGGMQTTRFSVFKISDETE